MAHIVPDFNTKKAAKEYLAAGKKIEAIQPGPFPLNPYRDIKGRNVVAIEAPADYHKWYAKGYGDFVPGEGFILTKIE